MNLEHIRREPATREHAAPILFVHGAWHGAWCWDQGFLEYFARRGFSVHALSLRGHGASDGRAGLRRARISDYVDDVKKVVAELGAEPILVGHSMGGGIVQKYLETNSAVAAVLMASLPPAGVSRSLIRTHVRHPLAALRMHLTLSLLPLVGSPELVREWFFSEQLPQEKLLRFSELVQDESYMAFLDMLALDLPKPRRVTAPMLVLGAGNDTIFLPDQIRSTAAAYGVEPVIFSGMAHDMMLEEGWEAVADTIISWLAASGHGSKIPEPR